MKKRLVIFFCGYMLIASVLYMRIGTLCTNSELLQAGSSQSEYTLTLAAERGMIYDSRFIPIVGQTAAYTAAILPCDDNFLRLSNNMSIEKGEDFEKKLIEGKPFLAKSWLPNVNIPFVHVFYTPERYAKKQTAQHILGYTNAEGKGVCGIELAYERYLCRAQKEPIITYRKNGRGEPLLGAEQTSDMGDVRTDGIVLTIDSRLQEICEIAGSGIKKGAIVVMEPSTGKLRAVASFPKYSVDELGEAIKDEENSPLLNRAYCAYSVGSIFKVVTAVAALREGISTDTTFTCTGSINIAGTDFGCHEKQGHGELNLQQALAYSCNPYFVQLSEKIRRETLLQAARDLSFGKGQELCEGIKTASGAVPQVDEIENVGDIANLSFGQGRLSATPIQIASMMSAVVNGGDMYCPTLIEGKTLDGKTFSEREDIGLPIKALEADHADLIKQYMAACVMETPNQNALPQYVTAGGKTGTAQTGIYEKDGEEKLQGWFVGFFPEEKPQYVVVVTVEEAESGNADASPIFKEIADKLNAPIIMPAELRGK